MSELNALYQDLILDHNKSPRNFRSMEQASQVAEGYNPLCGDRYTVYLKFKDDLVEEVSFTGAGCAISKASASVMTSILKGKTKTEALKLFTIFHNLITGETTDGISLEEIGRLAAFSGVSEYPARVKCASLAWHTMKNALEANAHTASTE
jgi:nitrogen fixation protein NifU and related proteins